MTYEELRAEALALCADLSATADDGADLDPDSLKERRAAEALSVLSGMPPDRKSTRLNSSHSV